MKRAEAFAEIERRATLDGLLVYANFDESKVIISILRDPSRLECCVAVSLSGQEPPTMELLDSRYKNAVLTLRAHLASEH